MDRRTSILRRRGPAVLGLLALAATTLLGCATPLALRSYTAQAEAHQRSSPETRPWFCDARGDGNAVGHGHEGGASHLHPSYAGQVKGPQSWGECLKLAHQFDQALSVALQWPTRAEAEAGGWFQGAPYHPGIGTHHIRGDGLLPTSFDPTRPVALMYEADRPDARLVGMSFIVVSADGRPPAGFSGGNDWWHSHDSTCATLGGLVGDNTTLTDAECFARGGLIVPFSNVMMLHTWIVPGFEYKPDAFTAEHPCLGPDGVRPAGDACWAAAGAAPGAPAGPPASGSEGGHDAPHGH